MNSSTDRDREGTPRRALSVGCVAPDDARFCELRRKARHSELLSASTVRLLEDVKFSGRLSIVVKNGKVQRSGYEEGLFEAPRPAQV